MSEVYQTMTARVNADDRLQTKIQFIWYVDNPLVVIARIREGDKTVDWDIGRELLWETSKYGRPSGIGDVLLSKLDGTLRIALIGEGGMECKLDLPAYQMVGFLLKTYKHISIFDEERIVRQNLEQEWIQYQKWIS